jgi:uncharacterized surface protein with fasciclin (FAS1) repeats
MQFTRISPSIQAFTKFVQETKTNLTALLNNAPALTSVLTYHVNAGMVYTKFSNTTLTMLNKQSLSVIK